MSHEPWAVMRLALPFSLFPYPSLFGAEIASLLYTFVLSCFARLLSRPPALCLPRQEPRTSVDPSFIHFPATAPRPPPSSASPFPSYCKYGTVLAIAATQATYVSSIIPPVLHRSAARPLLFPEHRCYCGCYYCTLRSSS